MNHSMRSPRRVIWPIRQHCSVTENSLSILKVCDGEASLPSRRGDRSPEFPLRQRTIQQNASTERGTTRLRLCVDFRAGLRELRCLLFQSFFDRCVFCDPLLCSKFTYILSDSHGTEVRTAH